MSAHCYNWPPEVRYLCRESIAETTYFLTIFCMRLFVDLHLQITNTGLSCAITPGQKLLFSALFCLFRYLLQFYIEFIFNGRDEMGLGEGRLLGLQSSLYFVYVAEYNSFDPQLLIYSNILQHQRVKHAQNIPHQF